jgi:hypothetical protein
MAFPLLMEMGLDQRYPCRGIPPTTGAPASPQTGFADSTYHQCRKGGDVTLFAMGEDFFFFSDRA